MPDLVTLLAGVNRKGRRDFYRKHKNELRMSWDNFNTVIELQRKKKYGK